MLTFQQQREKNGVFILFEKKKNSVIFYCCFIFLIFHTSSHLFIIQRDISIFQNALQNLQRSTLFQALELFKLSILKLE